MFTPTFKTATLTDINLLVSLMQEYYAYDQLAFDLAAADLALTGLIKNQPFGRAWTIWDGDEIAGYAVLTLGLSLEFGGRDAYIDEIYLRPNFRGQGIGRRTISFLEAASRQLGVNALHLEVERENLPAQAFYDKIGFKDHQRHLMTRWLNPVEVVGPVKPGGVMFTPALSTDVETLITLIRELNDYDDTPLTPRHERRSRAGLAQLLSNSTLGGVWLLETGRDVAGYMVLAFGYSLEYHGRDAMLDEFYLRPNYRRRGLGTKALEFAKEVCQAQGIAALHLEVGRSNTQAQAFYRRVGFADHDRFLMTKWLEGNWG